MQCKFRNTECAIKQLHKDSVKTSDMLNGLLDEFDVMMQLRHPNMLLTMGIAVDAPSNTIGIVMELMQASLFDVIYEPSFKPYANWDSAYFAIAYDVAKGMAFLHFNGLLHRDLKPGNVLIDAQWISKVADFGTTFSAADLAYEKEGEIAGTPPYMAPEILKLHKFEKPVDVWAFGCIIAHMSTQKIPYQQLDLKTQKQMLDVIKAGTTSPLELLFESKCPNTIVDVAKDCCLPDPKGRPTFQVIAERLGNLQGDEDPRPLVRIKGKKVLTNRSKGVASPSGGATADAGPAFAHSTYKAKFQALSQEKAATSDGPAEPSEAPAEGGGMMSFMDTFSQTILRTFTPGKEGEKKEEADNVEHV